MYKKLILTAALTAATVSAFAGGYVTNTNQNVAFLRNPAQNAVIGVQGAYFNPAGAAFMNNGWHLALDVQTAVQRRYTTSTYEPLKYGIDNNGKGYKKYTGKTFVPALPHLDLVYKHNNWFGSFHFGVVSGGGKAKYDQGLGSFEAPVAMIPALVNTLAGSTVVTGYDADIHLVGGQYNFAGQLNFGYKISKNWSVAAGLRLNYISNYYDGSLKNIQLQYGGNMLPAAQVLSGVISQLTGGMVAPEVIAPIAGGLVSDKRLDAHQKDIAYTPIISVDYKTGKFNFSARYEFNTKVRLENDTKDNSTGISQFDDDKTIAADIPASLNIGAQYSIKPNFRISLGANYYFDKQSKQYNNETGKNDKQNYLKHNSFEILGGLEYDVCKWATLSIGANSSTFGFGNDAKYISDMSYSTSSVSGGLGAQFHVTDKINIDLGIYKTFFMHFTKEQADYGGNGALIYNKLAPVLSKLPIDPSIAQKLTPENLAITGKDEFFRTSIVAGVGVSFAF